MDNKSHIVLRKAFKYEAKHIAFVHRKSMKTAMPFLPDLHTPEEDLKFIRDKVFYECDVWVVEAEKIVGYCAFKEEWVNHLYVLPEYQGQGLGSKLLEKAMEMNSKLNLWTFQKNKAAHSFYKAKGFVVVKKTDGQDNEEKEPDVLYKWTRQPI